MVLLKLASSSTTISTSASSSAMKLLKVQIVHRHGDRTPITPLADELYWMEQVIGKPTLDSIASNTIVVRDPESPNQHGAKGRGPFGQLTRLGLFQMIELGTTLRERYTSRSSNRNKDKDDEGTDDQYVLWTPQTRPLHPSTIKVYSTDFARTIQSVQGLLVGLFPEGTDDDDGTIEIDARHTSIMIPDPQPRRTDEQVLLEQTLASQADVRQRDLDRRPLALRISQSIQPLLSNDAHEVAFGVDQEHPGDEEIEVQPLAWNQLAEICKCLLVHNRLPSDITVGDVATIFEIASERWYRNLRHPRLNYLATNAFVSKQLDILCKDDHPPMTIWSAHDSTLIGLLCAYRLQQPSRWPDYGSYLALELVEVDEERFVRFSLNGEYLRIQWEGEEPIDMIPLQDLVKKVQTSTGEEVSSAI